MRINSFIYPGTLEKDCIVLSPDESHHLARVLRVEKGQELTLFDGEGTRAEGTVFDVSKKEVRVRILSRETVPPPPVEITLIQALPKTDRFETVLQKATELGVRRIQPVLTAHTVNRPKNPDKAWERWHSIIRNAAQQSSAVWIPELRSLKPIEEALPEPGQTDAVFIGSLYPGSRPFKECLRKAAGSALRSVALLIGPEGDFTEKETAAAVAAGAQPVTFGQQILRTETAAIFGLSILVYELF